VVRLSGFAIGALLTAVVAAGSPAEAILPERAPAAPTFARSVLTEDGSGLRIRRTAEGRVVMTGRSRNPDQVDWNRREVFTRPSARAGGPQTSCATWLSQSRDSVQQGLAIRVRDRRGRVRAVTLTKNVEFGLYWVFNVVTWDTARRGTPWRGVTQQDMSSVVGLSADELQPLPWRACLRARGRNVEFKVWLPSQTAEPSWSDPDHVRSARLPRGFAVGRPGWYAGHVARGDRMVYGDLTTRYTA
jgi:hypothetical protein